MNPVPAESPSPELDARGYLLHYGINSPKPIIEVLKTCEKETFKVRIIFGDHDWMDKEAVKENLEKFNLNIPYYLVRNAEHQLIFQNPDHIAELILEELKNKE